MINKAPQNAPAPGDIRWQWVWLLLNCQPESGSPESGLGAEIKAAAPPSAPEPFIQIIPVILHKSLIVSLGFELDQAGIRAAVCRLSGPCARTGIHILTRTGTRTGIHILSSPGAGCSICRIQKSEKSITHD